MFITAGFLNTITAASSSIIQSVQQVSITVASGSLSNTATISSVDTANTILVWGGTHGNDIIPRSGVNFCSAVLTNGTTVTVSRLLTAGVTVTVNVTVLEFATNIIDSIQNGVISVSGGTSTATATITSVVATDSVCHFQGKTVSVSGTGSTAFDETRIVLTNPTTITATRASIAAASNVNVHYTLARFKPGILNSSTQQIDFQTSAEVSCIAPIVSVNPNTSVFFWGNYTASSASQNLVPIINIESSTRLSINKSTASPPQRVSGTIVEFKSNNISNIQRGTIIFTSAATATSAQSSALATITSANLSKSVAIFSGKINIPQTQVTSFGQSFCSLTIFSPTEIKAESGQKTIASNAINGFQVISFK